MEMIGQKIKELRIKKGLTQEELAERTNLSVRTIQRIESGEVDPRTYTLSLLAEALDVELESLTTEKVHFTQKPSLSKADKTKWLALLHVSGLFVLIIFPIIVYLWKKEEIPEMEEHFTHVMNFQISVIVYILVAIFTIVLAITLPLIGILSTVFIVLNSIKVLNGKAYHYPLSIRFIK